MLSKKIAATFRLAIGVPLGSGAVSPIVSPAIRIDIISSRFALDNFNFEFNPQTGAAAIRPEYSYPPYRLFGDETYSDPGPRIARLPGLTYDAHRRREDVPFSGKRAQGKRRHERR